jgi:ubiquinone/menaquinone biosynthesis C-methylase UbiE
LVSDNIIGNIISQGLFFNKISGVDVEKTVRDLLNPRKALYQAEILQRYAQLERKKVLEVGSGWGINHIVWVKKFGIDGYGVEPDSPGFDSSFRVSRELAALNGLNPERILDAAGESLPFEDKAFDIVYSTNVLEHVTDPARVLDEGLRVLKPGGVLQFVYPNYHSYFDGHYAVFHPPVLSRAFFPWYVQHVWARDPYFATTLRTELNVFWTRRQLRRLKQKYSFDLISLGQEVFLERMRTLDFATWAGLTKVKRALERLRRLGLTALAARVLLWLQAWHPIILTLKKHEDD